MTKSKIYKYIIDAKIAHLTWVRKAEHLIDGLPVTEGMIPLDPTFCTFGKWLYNEGSNLRKIKDIDDNLNKIEKYHNNLHQHYAAIYEIFFILPKEESFLKKIIRFSSQRVSTKNLQLAKNHFSDLIASSNQLIYAINLLKKQIKALDFTDIKTMYS